MSDKNIESVKAEFFSSDIVIESEYCNYRIDYDYQRNYARIVDDIILLAPSWTAVSWQIPDDPFLKQWSRKVGEQEYKNVLKNSGDYGTFFHVMCGRILKGKEIKLNESWLLEEMKNFFEAENRAKESDHYNFSDTMKWYRGNNEDDKKRSIKKDLFAFMVWKRDWKVRPVALEYPLFDMINCSGAGTVDLIAYVTPPGKKDEKLVMIDLKSGLKTYDSHQFQLHFYLPLWNVEFVNFQIKEVYNYGCKSFQMPTLKKYLTGDSKTPPYRFENQTKFDKAWKLEHYIKLFHGDPDNFKIKKFQDPENKDRELDFNPDVLVNIDCDLNDWIEPYDPLDYLRERIKLDAAKKEVS